jgi:uncharacterized membrane protein YvbJ
MFWNSANTVSNAIWAILESAVILGAPFFWINKMFRKMDKRLDRIEYAIYNDGKTGLVNKVDTLVENQQQIKIDIEIMKVKTEE